MEHRELVSKYRHYTSHCEMEAEDRDLIEVARSAASRAVAPFSKFCVGAAARLASGEIVEGANVESDVYPAGICAERNMLFNAAVNYPHSPIVAVAITSISRDGECYPCGLCRQTLLDTESRQANPIRIIMSGATTATVVESAAVLLPFTFKL